MSSIFSNFEFGCALQNHYWFDYVVPENAVGFYDLSLEEKIRLLNAILILYNLHLIPDDVFELQYRNRVEAFDQYLNLY